MQRPWRVGTRASPLALIQAREAVRLICAAHNLGPDQVEIVPMRTRGDQLPNASLADIGGKGLFTMDIERALQAGRLDLAVHSLKDVPSVLPPGLIIGCIPPRADPREALIASARVDSLAALPAGARLGTVAPRRAAQVRKIRPDMRIVPLRGNVGTRLDKIAAGQAEATLLALAGLQRLGLAARACAVLEPDDMLPAAGQGALAVECRAADAAAAALLAPVHDAVSGVQAAAERAFVAALDGSCRMAVAALGDVTGRTLRLRCQLLSPDGTRSLEDTATADIAPADTEAAAALGAQAGQRIRARAGDLVDPAPDPPGADP